MRAIVTHRKRASWPVVPFFTPSLLSVAAAHELANGNLAGVRYLYDLALACSLPLTPGLLNPVILAYCRAGRVEEALSFLWLLLRCKDVLPDHVWDELAYLIWCKRGEAALQRTLEQFRSFTPEPFFRHARSAVLCLLAERKCSRAAFDLLAQLLTDYDPPSDHTLQQLLDHCDPAACADDCSWGALPTEPGKSARPLLSLLCMRVLRRRNDHAAALLLFSSLLTEHPLLLDEHLAVEGLLAVLAVHGAESEPQLREEMRAADVQLTPLYYHHLVDHHCERGSLQDACAVLATLEEDGVQSLARTRLAVGMQQFRDGDSAGAQCTLSVVSDQLLQQPLATSSDTLTSVMQVYLEHGLFGELQALFAECMRIYSRVSPSSRSRCAHVMWVSLACVLFSCATALLSKGVIWCVCVCVFFFFFFCFFFFVCCMSARQIILDLVCPSNSSFLSNSLARSSLSPTLELSIFHVPFLTFILSTHLLAPLFSSVNRVMIKSKLAEGGLAALTSFVRDTELRPLEHAGRCNEAVAVLADQWQWGESAVLDLYTYMLENHLPPDERVFTALIKLKATREERRTLMWIIENMCNFGVDVSLASYARLLPFVVPAGQLFSLLREMHHRDVCPDECFLNQALGQLLLHNGGQQHISHLLHYMNSHGASIDDKYATRLKSVGPALRVAASP
jgi:pentatricopeptide repeat protein